MLGSLNCDACGHRIPPSHVNLGGIIPCPGCQAGIRVDLFPAWLRPVTAGASGTERQNDTESACFYHPEKQAAVPCDACGRFLCSLCDVELAGRHLCPGCVDSGRQQGRLPGVENKRTLYDHLAVMYAAVPLLFFPATVVTAPYALYLTLRHYRAPGCLVSPSKWRFWVAGIIALIQIVAWLILLVSVTVDNL